jgi:hypothetical protein
MAEIKVFTPTETRLGPIGIVPMGDGAVRVGQQLASMGKQLRDTAYQIGYENEKQKGQEAATLAAISAKDSSGKMVFPEMPRDLSPTAQKYYEPIARKRFLEAVSLEVDSVAQKLAAQHVRDPDGFEDSFDEYLKQNVNTSGDLAPLVENIGALTSKQYSLKLFNDRVKQDNKIAASNALAVFESQNSNLESIARQQGGAGAAKQLLQNQIQAAADIAAEYPQVGVTFERTAISQSKYIYANGLLTAVTNRVADQFEGGDLNRKTPYLSKIYNALAVAVGEGSLEKIDSKTRSILARAGFTEATLKDAGFDEISIRNKLASNLSTQQGRIVEIFNDEKEQRAADVAIRNLSDNASVSQSDSNNIMSTLYNIRNGTDFGNAAARALTPPTNDIEFRVWESSTQPFRAVMFEQAGPLPKVAIDYLETVSSMPSSQIVGALNIYEQATRFVRGGGGQKVYTEFMPRGLDKDTQVLYETLLNVRDTVGNDAVPEFLSQYRETLAKYPDKNTRNALIKSSLGSDKSADVAVRQFISDINDDASADEVNFYASYVDDLLLTMDKKQVKKILKTASDSIFKDSNYLHPDIGRSQYAPEAAYPDTARMQIFEDGVGKRLDLLPALPNGKRPTLGEDVFLVPDTREGTAMPVYFLVDKDRMLLRVNGKPMSVGNQYVSQKIIEHNQSETARFTQEANEAAARTRKLQEQWDSGAYLTESP